MFDCVLRVCDPLSLWIPASGRWDVRLYIMFAFISGTYLYGFKPGYDPVLGEILSVLFQNL